jgi:hypothetical protein
MEGGKGEKVLFKAARVKSHTEMAEEKAGALLPLTNINSAIIHEQIPCIENK